MHHNKKFAASENAKKKCSFCLKKLAAAAGMALAAAGAQAGFVDEFFEENAQMTNVTQAGIVEAGALNVVSGGGFVYRTPRREFVPFFNYPSVVEGWVRRH